MRTIETGNFVSRGNLCQFRFRSVAKSLNADIAPIIEAAGFRQVHGKRNRSLDGKQPLFLLGSDLMDGTDQSSCIRMLGIGINL